MLTRNGPLIISRAKEIISRAKDYIRARFWRNSRARQNSTRQKSEHNINPALVKERSSGFNSHSHSMSLNSEHDSTMPRIYSATLMPEHQLARRSMKLSMKDLLVRKRG
jgi:hypothetical protein